MANDDASRPVTLAELPVWVQQDAQRIRQRLPEGWHIDSARPGENGTYLLVVTDQFDQPVTDIPTALLPA
jgi:hypothetical protein